ncbi:kinase-like domain-containing protein [Mycena maculata]|uniref:Kinase-like domain-containing protein n=1 Tax=Mycena maculata TaxID=230809 RepID=A0AAD7KAP9_9AGAR|nr:kinase-like domain-containing protein [Mycena maculata]
MVFLVLLLCCALGLYFLWVHYHSIEFDHEGVNGHDPETEWAWFRYFLSQHGLALYDTPEFSKAPTAPDRCAMEPFHPQEDENFVFRVVPCIRRTAPDIWTHLAVDSMGREVMIKAVSVILHHQTAFIVQARWGNWSFFPDVPTVAFWAGIEMYQLLEGLSFMHEHGIAHGDIHPGNILCNSHDFRSSSTSCPVFENFKLSPMFRLAFIDFGASSHFIRPSESCHVPCLRNTGPPPEFRAPELDHGSSFNPFLADVFSLGCVFSRFNLPKVVPVGYQHLIDDMTNPDPDARPNAHTAFECLRALNDEQKCFWG